MTSPSCAAGSPSARVLVVEEAGHSVQGDRPLELAEILATFHGSVIVTRDRSTYTTALSLPSSW